MPDNNSLIAIRERLAVIDAEITKREAERANVDAAIGELRAERSEFEVAERVLLRLQVSESSPLEDKPAVKPKPRKAASNGHAPRAVALLRRLHAMGDEGPEPPLGLPTNSEMISSALEYAAANNLIGFEPSEIVEYIKRRFWPDIPAKAIAPTVWRMWKDGEVGKTGSLYCTVKEELHHDSHGPPDSKPAQLMRQAARLEALQSVEPLLPYER